MVRHSRFSTLSPSTASCRSIARFAPCHHSRRQPATARRHAPSRRQQPPFPPTTTLLTQSVPPSPNALSTPLKRTRHILRASKMAMRPVVHSGLAVCCTVLSCFGAVILAVIGVSLCVCAANVSIPLTHSLAAIPHSLGYCTHSTASHTIGKVRLIQLQSSLMQKIADLQDRSSIHGLDVGPRRRQRGRGNVLHSRASLRRLDRFLLVSARSAQKVQSHSAVMRYCTPFSLSFSPWSFMHPGARGLRLPDLHTVSWRRRGAPRERESREDHPLYFHHTTGQLAIKHTHEPQSHVLHGSLPLGCHLCFI